MNKKVIILTIEITSRELESKCLLALSLINKGFRVYICTVNPLFTLKNRLTSCIFFHKSAYNKKASMYKKKCGAIFAFLDEELGVAIPRSKLIQATEARFLDMPKNVYDHVFTIGEGYKNIQEHLSQFEGVKVHATGWPRIDLWREDFIKLNEYEVKKIRKKYGSYYLMISSFNVMTQDILNQRRKECKGNQSQIDIEIARFEAFKNFVELAKLLSKSIDKNEKIILRPHPSESLEEWEKILFNLENISIVKEGSVAPWILGADAVIQYGSTVGLQAALNNIPSIQYKVEEKTGITDTPVFELSEHTDSISGVLAFLKKYKARKKDTLRKKIIDLIKNDVSSLDGELATKKIVKILDGVELVKQSKIKLNDFDKLKVRLFYFIRLGFDFYKKIIRLGKPTFIMSMKEKRPNGISKKEIEIIIRKLADIQSIGVEQITFEEVAFELISIEMNEK
jgi:surface carbohydrate biosynthesis protein